MEEHYKRTNYLDDLRALIFESRHELVKCQAELNVLSTRIPDIQKKCDKLAEDICEAKNSGESPSSERVQKLTEELVGLFAYLHFLRDREETAKKRLDETRNKLDILIHERDNFNGSL